jgi:3-hydroxybutyrate dehydrogenase
MSSLIGKTALVTGSTQGLGLATAERLAQAGCNVVLNGLADPARADAIRRDIEDRHGVRTAFGDADLSQPAAIERMMASILAAFGAIDILVNNAVVRHAAPVEHFSASDWDESLAVNLSAAFHTIRLALPSMRSRGWGRVVNVSSIYGLRGAANRIGYVTTKTALIGLTRAVALETAGAAITCNAVCPGTTRTPVHEAALQQLMDVGSLGPADAERALLAGKQPTGRLIAPENVAALIAFLCSPEASDITGAVLPVDGAWSAG